MHVFSAWWVPVLQPANWVLGMHFVFWYKNPIRGWLTRNIPPVLRNSHLITNMSISPLVARSIWLNLEDPGNFKSQKSFARKCAMWTEQHFFWLRFRAVKYIERTPYTNLNTLQQSSSVLHNRTITTKALLLRDYCISALPTTAREREISIQVEVAVSKKWKAIPIKADFQYILQWFTFVELALQQNH